MSEVSDRSPGAWPTLAHLLRWRAIEQPNETAYTFLLDGETDERRITYGGLDLRARSIAAQLQASGLGGKRVLVTCPPGLDYFAAEFGCMYAGAVPVLAYPSLLDRSFEPLHGVLQTTDAAGVITTRAQTPLVHEVMAEARDLRSLQWFVADRSSDEEAGAWRQPSLDCDDLAFLLLTSGSTAAPKGVMLSHGNMLSSLAVCRERFRPADKAHLVSWLPPHHSMSQLVSALQPLYSGFPATFLSPAAFVERPLRWLEAVSRVRGTISVAPNFAYDLCARTTPERARETLDLSSWDVAFTGGEPIRSDMIERFVAMFGPCGFRREAMFQAYGLTETMIVSLADAATPPFVQTFDGNALEYGKVVCAAEEDETTRTLVSNGSIPDEVRVEVVDPEVRAVCGPGEVGEIWLVGPSVGYGYCNLPDETEHAYRAYLASGEGPFFRTGDLGFVHDGELFICGRLKEVIIIRGRNLYPQNIELTAEHSHPALRPGSGAAFSIEVSGEERLIVVHEIEPRYRDRLTDVCLAVRQAVTGKYQVQVHAVVLIEPGSILRTPGGKIQRNACRSAFLEGRLREVVRSTLETSGTRDPSTSRIAPRTVAERTLAAIFSEVLRVEEVGIHDNYFELGGDSLLSMQIISRAGQAGLGLTVDQLFTHPTIAELGEVAGSATLHTAEQGLVTGRVPLTPRQRAFLEKVGERGLHFPAPPPLLAREPIDPIRLEQAVWAIFTHHDALRMQFTRDESGWQQVNLGLGDYQIFCSINLSDRSEPEQLAAMKETALQLRAERIAPGQPLFRVIHFDLGSDRPSRILFGIHHLIFDAFSLPALLEDLGTAYRQLRQGEPVQLPAKTTSLKEWGERLHEYAQSDELASEIPYWISAARRRVSPLPLDYPTATYRPGSDRLVAMVVAKEETQALLRELPRIYGTEINDVMLTALVLAFRRWTGSSSLLVDLSAHGREGLFADLDVSRTVGWLTSVFPVLLDVGGVSEPAEALQLVREQLRAIPNRGIGYGLLRYVREDHALVSQLQQLPKAHVHFNYHGQLDQMFDESFLFDWLDESAVTMSERQRGEGAQLKVVGQVVADELRLSFWYSDDLYERATIEKLALEYVRVLRQLIGQVPALEMAGDVPRTGRSA